MSMSSQICSDERESISEPEGSQVEPRVELGQKKRRKRLKNPTAFLEEILSDKDDHSQHLIDTRTDCINGENVYITPTMRKGKEAYLSTTTNSTGKFNTHACMCNIAIAI